MKTIKKFLFSLAAILTLTGCGGEKKDVTARLMEMDSYVADAEVTYISNKGENTFETKQYAKKDGRYRIETLSPAQYRGTVLIYDGKLVWQQTEGEGSRVRVTSETPERSLLLLYSFFENHEKSMESAVVSASASPAGNYTVLEAVVPGGSKFLASEKLWIDTKSGDPVKLVVYTDEGKEKIVVKFSSFGYNEKTEDKLFSVN